MTDITGFALLGHGSEMANLSDARIRFELQRLPFLEGAKEYADLWLFPAGTCNNERTFEAHVTFKGIAEEIQQLLYTPETSGGLLIALPPAEADRLEELYRKAGQNVWRVGEVVEGEGIEVVS
jgi:selenide,water dikinase